jgi:predicted AAA+ superfamily ATPase
MERHALNALKIWKNSRQRKPLILKGARQVGKTYLLKKFGQECFENAHYINFEKENLELLFQENLDPIRLIKELSFHLHRSINIDTDLLIFDEIQACPIAITSLKYFQEEMPELALCAAGSLLGVRLNSASFPVGKVNWLDMHPLTFSEFLKETSDPQLYEYFQNITDIQNLQPSETAHQQLFECLKHYFVVGGLPAAVVEYSEKKSDLFKALESVRNIQSSLIRDYYADIAKHAGKINAMHIDRIWQSVRAQLAQAQEQSSPKFKFKNIIPGIDRFSRLAGAIDWLDNAGLILKSAIVNTSQVPLQAYSEEGYFKLFMFDVGLLGAMSGLSPKNILDYDYGTYKGYFAENFVAQSLIASGAKELFTWQEKQAEVEFLQEISGEIIPIEVKSGSVTHAKSLAQFSKKYQPSYRIILSAKNLYKDSSTGTHFLPLYLAEKILN